MRISVIALGKLGAPLAAVLAAKGFDVVGVDVNEDRVAAVNEGRAPLQEPRLQEMIDKAQSRLSATLDLARAVAESDITFVVVPTPSEADGRFSMKYVLQASEGIGKALATKNGFHLVVLTSTVMPGNTDGKIRPALEAHSGKLCGRDFGLCYNPMFIALGSVVDDMLSPDFILIGESDERSGEMLAGVSKRVCENDPPVARMNSVNAELTKLAVNTFVTTRISYANMLSQMCEKLPGADVDIVTAALGLDSRIGRKYLRGALSYGGPCFPRDNLAFGQLARGLGVDPVIAEATEAINRLQLDHLAQLVVGHLPPGGTVGILGLSYKPKTDVVEASASIELAHRLIAQGISVVAYDPQAMAGARALLGDSITYADSAADCAVRADVLVIATPWAEFKGLAPAELKASALPPTVIDCWRILPHDAFEGACTYVTLGTGPAVDTTPPLVSIVTPVLNAAGTIEHCLESIWGQDYAPIELIVIDGGSEDGTVDILRCHRDRLAYWLSEPDGSAAAAFNKGLAVARGSIIAFLNADDWYEADAVSRAVAALMDSGADFTFGAVGVHGPGGPLGTLRPLPPAHWHDECLYQMPVPHISMFIRREALDRIGPFDGRCKSTSDHDQFIRLLAAGCQAVALEGMVGHIRTRGKADSLNALRESWTLAGRHGAPVGRRMRRFGRYLAVYVLRKAALGLISDRLTARLLARLGSRHVSA